MSMVALTSILAAYQEEVEEKIAASISLFGEKTPLRDACEYALMNGGKRLRPIISLMVAKALGLEREVSEVALSVEFFHTASLIADDLPCMDDDDMRRNKPSVHKVFGEATALLASYALIAEGYRGIYRNAKVYKSLSSESPSKDELCMLALENATFNTGLTGATGGQFHDIYPKSQSMNALRRVIHTKTVSLYEVSFVLAWLFGGGSLSSLQQVKQLASNFGMAFQIADDFDDIQQDTDRDCQSNFVVAFGPTKAKEVFELELGSFRKGLESLNLYSSEFKGLCDFLYSSAV